MFEKFTERAREIVQISQDILVHQRSIIGRNSFMKQIRNRYRDIPYRRRKRGPSRPTASRSWMAAGSSEKAMDPRSWRPKTCARVISRPNARD